MGIVFAIHAGYGAICVCNMSLLVEVSTFFLNYRSTFPKDELGKFVPMIHNFLFLICYTIFRVLLFPYGMWM